MNLRLQEKKPHLNWPETRRNALAKIPKVKGSIYLSQLYCQQYRHTCRGNKRNNLPLSLKATKLNARYRAPKPNLQFPE